MIFRKESDKMLLSNIQANFQIKHWLSPKTEDIRQKIKIKVLMSKAEHYYQNHKSAFINNRLNVAIRF
jgi:hypothetical protein